MKCEYCNTEFATKGNLKCHQINAKYCLELRNSSSEKWKCKYCEKVLASKQNLDQHYERCKIDASLFINKEMEIERLRHELKLKDEFIKKLEDSNKELLHQLNNLAEKAIDKETNIYNNALTDNRNINNSSNKCIDNRILNMAPLDITQESILKSLQEKFTENHLMKGQQGVAEFCIENILKTGDNKLLYKCTDKSRGNFIYIDTDGSIQKDINASKLTNMIAEPVKNVTVKLYRDLQDRVLDNMNFEEEVQEEDVVYDDQDRLNYATDKVCEITRLKTDNKEFLKNLIPPLS